MVAHQRRRQRRSATAAPRSRFAVCFFSPEFCIPRATLNSEFSSRRRRDLHSFRMTFFNSVRDTF
jgi:hypothetical protein